MSENSPIDDSFDQLVAGMASEEDGPSQNTTVLINVVNTYETFLLALCPTEYSENLLGTQRLCYTERAQVDDITTYDPCESDGFDLGEFQHFDAMFFRWRAGNLLYVWNRMQMMPVVMWGLVLKISMSSLMQALRTYRKAMVDADQSARMGSVSESYQFFTDMSPFVDARSELAQETIDLLGNFATDRLEQEDVSKTYEGQFDQQVEDSVLRALEHTPLDYSELLFDLCSITCEILGQTSKLYEHETTNDHKVYIESFCTSIRERILEIFMPDKDGQ